MTTTTNNTATPQEIAGVRADHKNAPQFATGNTHEAVIVRTHYRGKLTWLGVQYWNAKQIAEGQKKLSGNDGTSYFVCKLKGQEA